MYQATLAAPTNSPDSDPPLVTSNVTAECEDTTWTGGGKCCQLSNNITWRERVYIVNTHLHGVWCRLEFAFDVDYQC